MKNKIPYQIKRNNWAGHAVPYQIKKSNMAGHTVLYQILKQNRAGHAIILLVMMLSMICTVSAIPQTFNIHTLERHENLQTSGKLSNSAGVLTGFYSINFSLYSDYVGGGI